ncbi:lytic transglycosylase domain-containing protein [Octadecabacter sp.]|nr:lytic transglycosylase domain-containing protein [Octadecabacter sp.]
MKPILAAIAAAYCFAGSVLAQDSPEGTRLADIMAALDDGDTPVATALIAGADPVTVDVARWLHYRSGNGEFSEIAAFIKAHPNWPTLTRLQAAAERAIDEDTSGSEILAFLDGVRPETGEGTVALADALIAAGRTADAEAVIVDIWTTSALTNDGHRALVNAYPDVIEPHHTTRADMLLWRWRTSDAANVLPLLDEGEQALVRARTAYISRSGDISNRLSTVPDRLRGDPGLTYDRFNWLADKGDWTDASELLLATSTSADALGVPWRWGSWRRILARWQMREGNIDRAYALAADHFIAPDETNYADLEWVAGYLALTYLGDYARALTHFQNFDGAVSSPISKGRAGYWIGRTQEKLGNGAAAIAAYQAAARHQTSFYGLLSAEHLGLTLNPDIVGGENFGDWKTSTLLQNPRVQAGLSLLEAGQRGAAVLFIRDAALEMSRQQVGQLGQMLMDIQEPFYAVLAAKSAARNGVLVQDVYFPIHPMADLDLPVEPALALAIARQESEFRTDAGSSVGALGLMQLMPATAQEVAGWVDLPYNRGRLTTDWEYNAALGSEYLAYLTREFGDTPVMIAAGYNAGPSRPKQWMDERGDPRRDFTNPDPVDVVDWIEHIPFRETRNYVMRVTEGIPVYRARLTGQIGPVAFTDILVGAAPLVRPVARPDRAPEPEAAVEIENDRPPVRRAGELSPSAPAGPQSIRPVARAGE